MAQNGETEVERIWKFQLKDDSQQNGIFCITGDCDALGNWSTEKIVPLQLDELVFNPLISFTQTCAGTYGILCVLAGIRVYGGRIYAFQRTETFTIAISHAP